ncbi:N-acetyltransferase [Vibrio sp. SS-MA-C1-2]|uniref:GNAT family N-acetyltransferase n=1 Tax=Vibrio sp. SS-MA-C1-2 TaxID=2908646 RepID=UPI001F32FCE6|nr:N-acetyltransferase [Vibrio sp. SS-MA-C1-2]UJF19708.1 N-acetyltransferase [Vibrio sp. SS-MA-C1-2]
MLIRTEAPADILPINQLLKNAFPTDEEALLVMKLRENSRFTLSMVAANDEGELIGYLLFTPVTVNGEDIGWQGLAPVAVKEEYRKQGVAAALINEGVTMLAEFGYPLAVVLGEPTYYHRFGFVTTTNENLQSQWDIPSDYFMLKNILDIDLSCHQGTIEYSEEFSL